MQLDSFETKINYGQVHHKQSYYLTAKYTLQFFCINSFDEFKKKAFFYESYSVATMNNLKKNFSL